MAKDTTPNSNYQPDTENSLIPGTKEFGIPQTVGYIYYLIDINDEVVYVGQTCDIKNRIASHTRDKKFKKVLYKEVDVDALADEEFKEILKYLPIYNKAIPIPIYWNTLQEIERAFPVVRDRKIEFLRRCRHQQVDILHGYYCAPHYMNIIEDMQQEGDKNV